MSDYFKLGGDAYFEGWLKDANPYDAGTWHYQEWDDGWTYACESAMKQGFLTVAIRLALLPICLVKHDYLRTGGGSSSSDLLRWKFYKCKRCGRTKTKEVPH